MKLALAAFLMLFISACAKVQVSKEKAYATPTPGLATVYFYRESHYAGSALSYNIWDNDVQPVKLGSLKNGSYFFTHVKPGTHKFFVNGETQGASTLQMKAGQVYYLQMRIDMGMWTGRPKLTEVTAREGEKQIHSDELVMTELVHETTAK